MHVKRFLVFLLCLIMVGLRSEVADAGELLRRTSGSWFYGPESLYTVIGAGPASVITFFPLSEPIPSAGLLNARFSYQMTQDSGDCQLRAAVRYSSDGTNWDPAKEVDTTFVTNETPRYGATYVDLMTLANTTPKAWIQFGLQTVNRSGTSNAFCHGALRVEPQQR